MIKIRIKFRKYGVMKFIGHLDMMRYFQKAMRRADIDICYSEGFSPHQIMSFAAPLGVGITSDGEYLDIEVHSTRSTQDSIRALNDVMVEGVEVTDYVKLPDNAKTAMSIVAAADYRIWVKESYEPPADAGTFEKAIKEFFFERDEVLVTKQTKKGEKVMDLKKLVYDFRVTEQEGRPVFSLRLSAGSSDNIKPELVMGALFDFMGLCYDGNAVQIHRKDVYAAADGGFVALGALGTPIDTAEAIKADRA